LSLAAVLKAVQPGHAEQLGAAHGPLRSGDVADVRREGQVFGVREAMLTYREKPCDM